MKAKSSVRSAARGEPGTSPVNLEVINLHWAQADHHRKHTACLSLLLGALLCHGLEKFQFGCLSNRFVIGWG